LINEPLPLNARFISKVRADDERRKMAAIAFYISLSTFQAVLNEYFNLSWLQGTEPSKLRRY